MAQLLEAFLIGQVQNDDGKPLYGCEVVGKNWRFITIESRTYCISKTYDCTDREDLLQIIAILRKFREILETRLLD
jgi:Holliday junction resolvase